MTTPAHPIGALMLTILAAGIFIPNLAINQIDAHRFKLILLGLGMLWVALTFMIPPMIVVVAIWLVAYSLYLAWTN